MYIDGPKPIHELVKEARTEAGATLEQAAVGTGVSIDHLNVFEDYGGVQLGLEKIAKVLSNLGAIAFEVLDSGFGYSVDDVADQTQAVEVGAAIQALPFEIRQIFYNGLVSTLVRTAQEGIGRHKRHEDPITAGGRLGFSDREGMYLLDDIPDRLPEYFTDGSFFKSCRRMLGIKADTYAQAMGYAQIASLESGQPTLRVYEAQMRILSISPSELLTRGHSFHSGLSIESPFAKEHEAVRLGKYITGAAFYSDAFIDYVQRLCGVTVNPMEPDYPIVLARHEEGGDNSQ